MKLQPEWVEAKAQWREERVPPASGRLAAILVASSLVWLLSFYGETLLSMMAIWRSSETFAHGFLIAPISAWLIWQRRHTLAQVDLRPAYLALPLLAAAGFVWFFAGLGGVVVAQQFALVLMIPLALWAIAGTQAAKALAFPLLFLLFAVPFGEFLEGVLMEHTADFTVAALRLTGIPVYREGQSFMIPSGNWSVVEACSGLRYLIASLTVGVLFAYLTYRSFVRRALFVAASVLVPIVANWFRAYMIVMIGHLSGMKYAVGVDHLIYGWLFFGVVMMLLFWVGAYWREDNAGSASSSPQSPAGEARRALGPMTGVAVAAALVAAAWPVAADYLENASTASAIVEVPRAVGGWEAVSRPLTSWKPRFQEPRAIFDQTYTKDTSSAGVHIRYYHNQRKEAQLISSQNVLVSSENREWAKVSEVRRSLVLAGDEIPAQEARLKSNSGNLLVWRLYWIDGAWVANQYLAKLLQATSVLTGRGDDGAAVFLYVPYSKSDEETRQKLQEFTDAMLPAISTSLANARHSRTAR